MKRSLAAAVKASKELRELDGEISTKIREVEQRLFELNVGAFDTGPYSWVCRRGQWRFVLTSDRTPVLDLPRNKRCHFLRTLKLPEEW